MQDYLIMSEQLRIILIIIISLAILSGQSGYEIAKKLDEKNAIELKQKLEEEERIKEENRRIKEWEEKFDEEQKMKEDALIEKFYTDKSSDQNAEAETIEKNEEENKNI